MAEGKRPNRPPRHAAVVRREELTPNMVRLVLGGEELAGMEVGEFTDHYVKLLFPDPDSPRPPTRTYTVRDFDAERRELTLDFVVHGDEGLAGPWAANAQVGDEIGLLGPGGGYAPAEDVDWHLFVGDESALPAIAVSLERIPADRPALVLIEIENDRERQQLPGSERVDVRWIDRSASELPPGEELTRTVAAADFPAGEYDAFVHGDAGFVRDIRRHLRGDRALPTHRISASGYWKRGRNDEAWRAEKKEWKAAVEADDAGLGTA